LAVKCVQQATLGVPRLRRRAARPGSALWSAFPSSAEHQPTITQKSPTHVARRRMATPLRSAHCTDEPSACRGDAQARNETPESPCRPPPSNPSTIWRAGADCQSPPREAAHRRAQVTAGGQAPAQAQSPGRRPCPPPPAPRQVSSSQNCAEVTNPGYTADTL
jgi:hypothetical protein